jgi:serine/threonine protein kinase
MYSCGLVIAELITGRPLFAGRMCWTNSTALFKFLVPLRRRNRGSRHFQTFPRVTFHHYDPQLLENVLPRANECPKLMTLLKSLIVLDPMQRRSAKKALEEDLCQTIPFGFSAMDLIPTECKGVLSQILRLRSQNKRLCHWLPRGECAITINIHKRTKGGPSLRHCRAFKHESKFERIQEE